MARKPSTAKKTTTVRSKATPAASRTTTRATTKTLNNTERKLTGLREPMTKTQLYATIAENTNLSKKDVVAVFDELNTLINRHIKKRSAGVFTLPGLLKITTVKKPARKAQKNVPNPFKPGETMDVAAKPARTVVKVRPLKKLKDMVA
ncbi:histone family protein DNA-binding protein [Nitrosococcus halophilus Nc 4]|uniref:Viral histone-like protein n=1 Tax=Nitrosococcus halophilus (strain Nc4) TaxID=472759 RepID=D5C4D6_NITHN|nr:HU family DNA-binding protein [Nitrosococcus halophilus]ADE15120.1 histone family protein DNA-binding protein [Nitrosococcus halophilus Nc 4]